MIIGADAIIGHEALSHVYLRSEDETDEQWFTRRGKLIIDFASCIEKDIEAAQASGNPLEFFEIRDRLQIFDSNHCDIVDTEYVDESYIEEDSDPLPDTDEPEPPLEDRPNKDHVEKILSRIELDGRNGDASSLLIDAQMYATLQFRDVL